MNQDDLDSITINLGDLSGDYTINLTSPNNYDTITVDPNLYSQNWTGPNANPLGSWSFNDITLTDTKPSSKLQLEGENADIEINGRSVMGILDSIEQRLGLLKCREDLESEWDELRAVGDRYRELVKEIEEKSTMWETLKKMPPPDIT